MVRVFVYGTLMKNRYNHNRYLKRQRYLGAAVLEDYALYDLGSYPGVIPDEEEKVLGELYEIDLRCLKALDYLEGNGRLYIRQNVEVILEDAKISAQVYVYNWKVKKKDKIKFSDQPWK